MNLQFWWDIFLQYGLPVLIAFFAWLQRRLEKPVVEHEAARGFADFLNRKGLEQHGINLGNDVYKKFEEFLEANPQIKPRKKKR